MRKAAMQITVESHAGYRGEEGPRRFHLGERTVEVVEVVDRWLDPEHRYFKIRADDGGIYLLRHDALRDSWEITMFDSGTREDTRLST